MTTIPDPGSFTQEDWLTVAAEIVENSIAEEKAVPAADVWHACPGEWRQALLAECVHVYWGLECSQQRYQSEWGAVADSPEMAKSAADVWEETLVSIKSDLRSSLKFEHRIGKTELSQVFKVLDRRADVPVHIAVKIVPGSRQQTEAEAAKLKRLNHPNVVNIQEFKYFDDTQELWILMPLYPTRLADIRKGGIPRVDTIIELIRGVAQGLKHCHQHQIFHGDIKEDNIMLDRRGTPVIIDFNIAADASERVPTAVRGTPLMMSPEQVQQHPIDGRTDLWSLGVLIYFLVGGSYPWSSTGEQLKREICEIDPAPLSQYIPEDRLLKTSSDRQKLKTLTRICHRLLQKKPEDRFQSASELISELNKIYQTEEKLLRRLVLVTAISFFCIAGLLTAVVANNFFSRPSPTVEMKPEAKLDWLQVNIARDTPGNDQLRKEAVEKKLIFDNGKQLRIPYAESFFRSVNRNDQILLEGQFTGEANWYFVLIDADGAATVTAVGTDESFVFSRKNEEGTGRYIRLKDSPAGGNAFLVLQSSTLIDQETLVTKLSGQRPPKKAEEYMDFEDASDAAPGSFLKYVSEVKARIPEGCECIAAFHLENKPQQVQDLP